ncbi:alpha/beta fold hydrolase [Asticcacaulis sp. AC466]|uniref:alpha/beta fold hydrolase n=1 Tax=Asticcacaulis sp. AC466 TaxID=1282362 RepID=UPI00041F3BC4|nr:alpha/beta hydrolase [Asticcacaulis sp. AC466]
MTDFSDIYYASSDGRLPLYARDYGLPQQGSLQGIPQNGPAILCLHGLTRNSADFHDLAMHLKGRYRVICADQRGRGRSQWDPDAINYQPLIYAADMVRLLDYLSLDRVIVIGTSMGGLMAMILGTMARTRLVAVVMNDVGPELDPAGLARIASYTGKTPPAANWAQAAELAKLTNGVAFPDYGPDDWVAFARRLYTENAEGVPVLAYDPAISGGLKADTQTPVVPPDLWAMWDALAGLPILAIRGALSDLLSARTLEKMAQRHDGLKTVTVPNRGHAPMLDEPEAIAAIDAFLAEPRVSA